MIDMKELADLETTALAEQVVQYQKDQQQKKEQSRLEHKRRFERMEASREKAKEMVPLCLSHIENLVKSAISAHAETINYMPNFAGITDEIGWFVYMELIPILIFQGFYIEPQFHEKNYTTVVYLKISW